MILIIFFKLLFKRIKLQFSLFLFFNKILLLFFNLILLLSLKFNLGIRSVFNLKILFLFLISEKYNFLLLFNFGEEKIFLSCFFITELIF